MILLDAFSNLFVVLPISFVECDRWGLVKAWEVARGEERKWDAMRRGVALSVRGGEEEEVGEREEAVPKLGVEMVREAGGREMEEEDGGEAKVMAGEETVRVHCLVEGEEAKFECRKLETKREKEEEDEEGEEGEATEALPSHLLFASL